MWFGAYYKLDLTKPLHSHPKFAPFERKSMMLDLIFYCIATGNSWFTIKKTKNEKNLNKSAKIRQKPYSIDKFKKKTIFSPKLRLLRKEKKMQRKLLMKLDILMLFLLNLERFINCLFKSL